MMSAETKLREDYKAELHQHHVETGQLGGDNECGSSVQSLQRILLVKCAGISFATGIYILEVIATVRENNSLAI